MTLHQGAELVGNRWFIPNDAKNQKIRVKYKKTDRKRVKWEERIYYRKLYGKYTYFEKWRGLRWGY